MTCPCPPSQVLKILLHTCSQGSPQFVLQLKRNASFIREAAGNSGGDTAEQQQPHGGLETPEGLLLPGLCQEQGPTPPGSVPHPPFCVSAVFSGPPDPLHGNSLNQKVRAAAQVGAGGSPQPLALGTLGFSALPPLLSVSVSLNPTGPGQHSVLGCAAAAAPGTARTAPGPRR